MRETQSLSGNVTLTYPNEGGWRNPRLICQASGKSPTFQRPYSTRVSSPSRKNILLYRIFGLSYITSVPPHQRGVAQRQQRGAGCGGRQGCSRRRRSWRTEKTRGPGTSTLVSSSWKETFAG